MGMMFAALAAALFGTAAIVTLSRHLARLDEARDGIPPSCFTYGDEP